MIPNESFKSLGIFSIVLMWLGLLFLIYNWRGNKSMSFSLHAAQSRGGHIFYILLFSITLPLFFLFIINWYVPALNLPNLFTYLLIIGIIGQLIAAWVPAVGGLSEKIHNFGAYTMASMLIPLSVLVVFAKVPTTVQMIAIAGIIYMVPVWILHFNLKSIKPNYLYFQSIYIAIFHLIILMSTYLAKGN